MGRLTTSKSILRAESRRSVRDPMLCRASISMAGDEWEAAQAFFHRLWEAFGFSGEPQASRMLRILVRRAMEQEAAGELDVEKMKKVAHDDVVAVALSRAMAPKKTWMPAPDLLAAVEDAMEAEEIDEDLVWGRTGRERKGGA